MVLHTASLEFPWDAVFDATCLPLIGYRVGNGGLAWYTKRHPRANAGTPPCFLEMVERSYALDREYEWRRFFAHNGGNGTTGRLFVPAISSHEVSIQEDELSTPC
jgi:hypothetical protein